jgi:hypothetical protein
VKISFDKIPFLNKLLSMFRARPLASYFIIAFFLVGFGYLIFTGTKETKEIRKSLKAPTSKGKAKENSDKDVGVLVGSVDTKSYVSRIEKEYFDMATRSEALSDRIMVLEKAIQDLHKSESDLSKIVKDIDNRIAEKIGGGSTLSKSKETRGQGAGPTEETFGVSRSVPLISPKTINNLEMAKVGEIRNEDNPKERYAYLPLGSFVKCTLLTGVYAPSNESNPLPVLISVDEAFYGPNNTRIPLKGAFAIGKAIGDVVSKRAIIQIVSLSMALPDGKVFEHEGNLGYLAGEDGHLGIEGQVIYNTGRQLGLNFLSGFLAGGAEALSQAETSTVTGAYGQTSRNVTGDTGRYAMFSGLANSAQGMSNYYQKQLNTMIPAVKIEAGKKVIFVVQKGVQIEGLESGADNFDYIDN